MSVEQCPHYRAVSESQLTQDLFNQILCPNLRIGVRMSMLNPDADGWVKSSEMLDFLTYLGVKPDSLAAKQLISISETSTPEQKEGHINITAFKEGFLDHGSSSGILNNPEGFSQTRLDYLKQFANQQGRLYKKELAKAANMFHSCPANFASRTGTQIQSLELATILTLYGRRDHSGRRYFEISDLEELWRENRFPKSWGTPKKSFYGTLQVLLKYFSVTLYRVIFIFSSRPKSN